MKYFWTFVLLGIATVTLAGCGNKSQYETEAKMALNELIDLWEEAEMQDEAAVVDSEGLDTEYESALVQKLYTTLDAIKVDSRAEFGEILPLVFEWRVENASGGVDVISVEGYGMSVLDVPMDDYDYATYFKDNGWTMDLQNIADGTVGAMEGYFNDEVGCLIYREYSEMEESVDTTGTQSVEIKCGSVAVG